MTITTVNLKDISSHRDLRVGLGITSFNEVVTYYKQVAPTYQYQRFGKVATLEYGAGLTEAHRNDGEYPVMGSNGRVGFHDDYLIKGPSIIVGRKGSAGEVIFEEKDNYPIDTTFYVKPKTDQYDLKVLYYLLKQTKLQRLALFKGVPGLNRYDAYELEGLACHQRV